MELSNKKVTPLPIWWASDVGGPKRVANLWTEFAAHEGEALIANGKELQNPNKLVVAATYEMAKT